MKIAIINWEPIEKISEGGIPVRRAWPFFIQSSDQDLIFLGQASMGIKNDLQKKNEYFM